MAPQNWNQPRGRLNTGTMTESNPKRGRPRKHASNAAKQTAYRKRKQDPERKALVAKILKRMRVRHGEDQLAGLSIRKLKWTLKFLDQGRRRIS
jgi:hypothetical protein